MNLFVLDTDPVAAAQMHNDRHVCKMAIEYAQLLSAAHHVWQSPYAANVYKLTHKRHPSTLWVAEHPDHYAWTFALACATWDEYTHRYGRIHASSRLRDALQHVPMMHPATAATAPPQCMPNECKAVGNTWTDVVRGYRTYYRDVKRSFATWKQRDVPAWFTAHEMLFTAGKI